MAVRVTGADDTGFVELLKESAYGDGGSNASDAQHWLEGTSSMQDTREVVPRPIISGRAPVAMRHLRRGAGGGFEFDIEYEGMGRWFDMLFGGYEKLGATAPYDNLFYPAGVLPSYGAKKYMVGEMTPYPGCKLNRMTIEYIDGEPLKMTVEILARNEGAAIAAVNADSGGAGTPIYHPDATTVSIGGQDMSGLLHSLTIDVNNNLADGKWAAGQTGRAEPQRAGHMEIDIAITAYWDDLFHKIEGPPNTGFYADYLANLLTTPTLSMIWNNGLLTTAEKEFQIYCPNIIPVQFPKEVNTPGVPEVTVNFKALDGTIAQDALTVINGTLPAAAAIDAAPIAVVVSNAEDGAAF